MRVIIVLLGVLAAIAIFSVSDEKLSKKAKFIITFSVIFVAAALYFYETRLESEQGKRLELVALFNQGKTLKCGNFDVNNTKFNYEFGTSSFVTKRAAKELNSVKIALDGCEFKGE